MPKSAGQPREKGDAKQKRPKFKNLPDPSEFAGSVARYVNVLLAWIGKTDIGSIHRAETPGPIRELLRSEYGRQFDEVHLIHSLTEKERSLIADFEAGVQRDFSKTVRLHEHPELDPIKYDLIFPATLSTMKAIEESHAPKIVKWHIHTSPGSSAMQASLLILGSTRFQPATFYWTYFDREAGKLSKGTVDLPFALKLSNYSLASHDTLIGGVMAGSLDASVHFESILGHDPRLEEIKRRAMIVARSDARVLIQGESGTGKELFAKAIHNASPRVKGQFRAINCAGLQNELVEIELFGAVSGAYTSCDKDRTGFLAVCDKGTLFLDELAELSAPAQAKLLRYLNDQTFYKVGSTTEEKSDARIITATNEDLRAAVIEGRFRSDLYYRIAECVLYIPPIRERGADIDQLAQHFLDEANDRFGKNEKTRVAGYRMKKRLGDACLEFLRGKPWPGNARELKLVIHRTALFNMTEEILTPEHLKRELEPMAQS